MKNLVPVTRTIHYWDNIVDNKNIVNRTPLLAARANVQTRFNDYTARCQPCTLETIPVSPFTGTLISILKSCYADSVELDVLKTRINERQAAYLRSECQYCNISEPNSFDHYLPKGEFPEFSAFSHNLIPCCSKCNSAKGSDWILAGDRQCINFYYDVLPAVSYLDCTINYVQNVPVAQFSLNTAVIPAVVRAVIVNHFSLLELYDRYRERSNSEIIDVQNAIVPHVGVLTRLQIQSSLSAEAAQMKLIKGHNYWRAQLRIALSTSIPFLVAAGF